MVELKFPQGFEDRKVQLVSTHIPSAISSHPDEVDEAVRTLGHVMDAEGRRTWNIFGFGANLRLDAQHATARVVGRATETRNTPPANMARARDLVPELKTAHMSVVISFCRFWEPERLTDFDGRSRFQGTSTWQGQTFGTRSSITIDFVAVEQTTLQRTVRLLLKGIWPYPTDHRAVGVELDPSLFLAPSCTYVRSRKPIGWCPLTPITVPLSSPRWPHTGSNFRDLGRDQESVCRKRWFTTTPRYARDLPHRSSVERNLAGSRIIGIRERERENERK